MLAITKAAEKGVIMEPYLVFSDIDGTLVIDHQIVTPFTKRVIRELQQRDVIFYIATGRMYNLGKVIARQINDDARIIASNGAVFENEQGSVQHHLGHAALKAAYEITQSDLRLSAHFFTTDAAYYTREIPRFVARDAGNLTSMGAEINYDSVADLDSLLAMSDQIINGIIVCQGTLALLASVKQRLGEQDVMSLSSSGPDNIELIPKGIDKARRFAKFKPYMGLMQIIPLFLGMVKMILACYKRLSIVLPWGMLCLKSKQSQIM